MMKVGWLRHDYKLILIGFCDVSARRKSLGRKIRSSVLNANSICAICGTNEGLVIDHIVPVSRGGGSELSNLQSLCRSCNAQKGTRTMNEFLDFLRTMEEILK
jgi:5-methylcytosine-specific restriction endonuclease McrA